MYYCDRCGEELKVITVQVPVYLDHMTLRHSFKETRTFESRVLLRYDEEEQVCDCPRCHGAY